MTPNKKILIVDDDTELLQVLCEQLQLHKEFTATGVGTGADALKLVKSSYYDVILLDIGLPDMDGRDICRLMRRNGVSSLIVMLTVADTDADIILGLDAGANDYITKPFRIGVLLARLRAHFRQHERSDDATFSIGRYSFRPANKLLVDTDDGKKVHLTDKETGILKFLYRQARGKAVGRDTLLNGVWGHSAGASSHSLETHVYRLRQKIEIDPSNAEILITESGGYRLIP